MNFITILSIFLIVSFQFSSLVSENSGYGSEYRPKQISTPKTLNNNVGLSTIIRGGYSFGKKDQKGPTEKVTKKETTQLTTEVPVQEGTVPDVAPGFLCTYCN